MFPEREPTAAHARAPCQDFCLRAHRDKRWRRDRRARPGRIRRGDHRQGDQHRQRRRRGRGHWDCIGQRHHDQCRSDRQRSIARPDHRRTWYRIERHPVHLGQKPRDRKLRHPEFCQCRAQYLAQHVEQLLGVEYDCFNSVVGISVQPTGTAVVTGVLSDVTANNNGSGILVVGSGASLNVTIANSDASNNSSVGVGAGSAATAIMLRDVVASNNNTGLAATASSTLRVGHSVVTGNVTGVFSSGSGVLDSYGDNDIDGNTTDNTGILTVILPH
ncbi:MAG: NosD domain-containing protein [Methylocella sp.]